VASGVDGLRGAAAAWGVALVVNSGVYGVAKKSGLVVNEKVRSGIFFGHAHSKYF
jgi:hypothetical protein